MDEYQRSNFAGFWSRFVALIMDVVIVSFIVFPLAIILGLISPKYILVEVPFDFFTTTTIVSEDVDKNTSIVKDEVIGLWTNYFKITRTEDSEGKVSTSRTLVDGNTYTSINKTTSNEIEFFFLFIYWIIFEASILQASLGKKIMGLKVITQNGGRPSISQCIARNFLKILSFLIFLIGFLMVGWTNRKQALHDMIPNLFIIKSSYDK